jgi:hypothetical protein
MRAINVGIVSGGLALLLAYSTSSEAQARRGPPTIRIYSDNGVDYVGTSTYITPRIELSENAYVFAVEMDMDGQVQVLHPDMPGISVRINASRSLQLPNFFAGFNSSRYGGAAYAIDRDYYDYYGRGDTRGTIIALASRVPFNLEQIESYGDWDLTAIRHLIENRSPLSAADALARYIGQAGEPIGRDYLRFEGARSYGYPYYASAYDYYSPCATYYAYGIAPGFAFSQLQNFAYVSRMRAGGIAAQVIGYDLCGLPIFGVRSGRLGQRTPIGHFPPPRPGGRGDTTVFPKGRLPRTPTTRPGTTVFANTLEPGVPVSRAGTISRMGDGTIEVPTGRRAEPRQFVPGYPGGDAIPQGRAPIERVTIPRAAPTAGGATTVPRYRPEPRVEPAPARIPESPRTYSPPPVIRERPSNPTPPPPRVQPPPAGTEPARTPPPSRAH